MFSHFFASLFIGIAALFGFHGHAPIWAHGASSATSSASQALGARANASGTNPESSTGSDRIGRASAEGQGNAASSMPRALSESDLEKIASGTGHETSLPLGDGKYVTDGPKQGYIYLCDTPPSSQAGAKGVGSWIHGSTWDPAEKISVRGSVSWPNAQFSETVSGDTRTLIGNGLPVGYTTGIFPIAIDDPAHAVDGNPNSIKAQAIDLSLPVHPKYLSTPHCMGMEVGVMNSGVPLLAGFDAELRDAVAHETQDSCDGHPDASGEYHYHGLSACFKNVSVSTVLGYALDGIPITGPEVVPGKFLMTKDLDVCHGITSSIVLDGKLTTEYHYVMTEDFPYSVSCFRGDPVSLQIVSHSAQGSHAQSRAMGQTRGQAARAR